jgi:hypothetical protein
MFLNELLQQVIIKWRGMHLISKEVVKSQLQIRENYKSKRASFDAGPLLTNPLNSCTKLQISAT